MLQIPVLLQTELALFMGNLLKRVFSYFLFWVFFFALCRTTFIIFFYKKWEGEGLAEMFRSYWSGLPMDFSAAAYIALLPLFVWGLFYVLKKQVPAAAMNFYLLFFIVLYSLLTIADFNIYREWGSKINYHAFKVFFETPRLAMVSSSSSPLLLSFFVLVLLLVTGIWLYRKLMIKQPVQFAGSFLVRIALVIVALAANVVIIRGGISTSPLTFSSVYYSKNQTLNYAATNTGWNLIGDIIQSKNDVSNPFIFMDSTRANSICDSSYYVTDSTVQVVKAEKPNVVLIILESYPADLFSRLGGEKGVAPFLDSLMGKGLLFSNLYASGNRTDLGFISVHTGMPSLATRSYMSYPEKMFKLPSIADVFQQHQYQNSFYYGGESEFYNFRSFILNKGYKRLIDVRDFSKDQQNSKWGAHDEFLFKRVITDLKNEQQPFFSTIMTLSNHEPFEVPRKAQFPGETLPDKFRSTAYYTDQCLKDFFTAAAKEPWYRNTLFLLIADHGHRLPKEENEIFVPRRYHIPFLMFGEVLDSAYRGKDINKVASQSDLPATLLGQLGMDHKAFSQSKNLLNPNSKEFAFSTFENGFVFIEKEKQFGFDNNNKKVIYYSGKGEIPPAFLEKGKAFMQKAYADFLKY